MLRLLVLVSALAALSAASDLWGSYPAGSYPWGNGYPWWGAPWNYYWGGYPGGYYGYGGYGGYYGGYAPYNRLVFYGKFEGTCESASDGIYFVDDRSFAYCSNGQKTIQPCAEGSANPPIGHFKAGQYYALYDFCSVNLVAKGYGPKAAAPSYKAPPPPPPPKEAYPEPRYEEKTEYATYQETSYEKPKPDFPPKY